MPLDQVSSLSPELSVLQDPLDLVLLIVINYDWWGVGLHPIILIGIEQSNVKDIMDLLQCLPVASSSEVQVVGYLPYPYGNGESFNVPVMQLPGPCNLRFLVLSST